MSTGATAWLVTGLGIIIGAGVLLAFYQVVKTEWPTNYASLGRDFGVVVNRSFWKYAAFALVPTYVVALLVSTTVGREGAHAMACALGIGLLHTLRTQGVLIVGALRQKPANRSNPIVIYAVITAVGLLFASWLGGLGPGPAQFVVPPLEEFFNAFWTTAFVVVLAVLIARTMTHKHDIGESVQRSRQEIGERLRTLARESALSHRSDPRLVEAILLTENLQRPSWFRRIERIKGLIFRPGTYGPMQVWSPRPLTDEASITSAVSQHLSGVRVTLDRYGSPDQRSLRTILRRYNPNPNFVDLAEQIYTHLYYEERSYE